MSARAKRKARAIEHLTVGDVQQEVHKLHEREFEGESAETPALALAGVAMLVIPIVILVIGLTFAVAYLW